MKSNSVLIKRRIPVSTQAQKIVQRVPLPWAVAMTVAIALPFGLFLNKFNIPLWVCFIVWAEYFMLGAKPDTWKVVFPSIAAGGLTGALWMATTVLVTSATGTHMIVGLLVGNFVWVTALLYLMPRSTTLTTGTLSVFNGLALYLAVYFTGSVPSVGMMENPYWVVTLAFLWMAIAAYAGWFLGWLNILLTFPHVES
jgi:hypothetical protein